MQLSITQLIPMIITVLKAGQVPMIQGSPGVGKSSVGNAIAEKFKLKMIDLRLSQCDPTDINGFPNIDLKTGRASYMPMDTFPLEGDPIPEGYNGWLLFLDEFNSASMAVQAASYKLVLDKAIGQRKLHPKVAIICAGNRETDGAIVNPLSTALQSRLIHFEVFAELESWMDWAAENNINHRITSYLQYKPEYLDSFSPDHSDKTYACPRTWAFASKILEHIQPEDESARAILSGTLGEGIAREFILFCKIHESLPSMQSILGNPSKALVPEEISAAWAIAGALATHMDKANASALIEYISRFPIEMQVFCLRTAGRKHPEIRTTTAFQKWITHQGASLFKFN